MMHSLLIYAPTPLELVTGISMRTRYKDAPVPFAISSVCSHASLVFTSCVLRNPSFAQRTQYHPRGPWIGLGTSISPCHSSMVGWSRRLADSVVSVVDSHHRWKLRYPNTLFEFVQEVRRGYSYSRCYDGGRSLTQGGWLPGRAQASRRSKFEVFDSIPFPVVYGIACWKQQSCRHQARFVADSVGRQSRTETKRLRFVRFAHNV
jgi:hypothetical protein